MSITYAKKTKSKRLKKKVGDGYQMRRVRSLIVMEIWWVSNVDNSAMSQKIRQKKPFNVDKHKQFVVGQEK